MTTGLHHGFQRQEGTRFRIFWEINSYCTWIIPVSKWLITMVSKSPTWGYSPYKWPKRLVNGGLLTTLTNWDDPPSRWWQLKYFLIFMPPWGFMIQFDERAYLKPPTTFRWATSPSIHVPTQPYFFLYGGLGFSQKKYKKHHKKHSQINSEPIFLYVERFVDFWHLTYICVSSSHKNESSRTTGGSGGRSLEVSLWSRSYSTRCRLHYCGVSHTANGAVLGGGVTGCWVVVSNISPNSVVNTWGSYGNSKKLGYFWKTRWWFQIFFIFTPKIGEDEPILMSIFFKGVGSVQPPTRLVFEETNCHAEFDSYLANGPWNKSLNGLFSLLNM